MICTWAWRKLSSIELEMYKQYMDELHANAPFEARNVQNCVKLGYAREAFRKSNSIELDIVQTVYWRIAREARCQFWS